MIPGTIEGKRYDFQPTHPDHMGKVATTLLDGEVAFVTLQPGDMTRYDFYLIPQTEKLRIPERFGLGPEPWEDSRYVWFAPCNLPVKIPGDIISLRGESSIFYDLDCIYKNIHTVKIITIFLDLLNQMMITGDEGTALDVFASVPAVAE